MKNINKKALYEYCYLNSGIFNRQLLIESGKDEDLSQKVRKMIDSDNYWVRNDYNSFIASLCSNDKEAFLTPYTANEIKEKKIQTFQLRKDANHLFQIGFALHQMEDGEVDIISVHNSETNIGGVGDNLIRAAVRFGGTQLDHFNGKLSGFYGRNGFIEYKRDKWDDKYAPKGWDYEKYGRPDIIYRKLQKKN